MRVALIIFKDVASTFSILFFIIIIIFSLEVLSQQILSTFASGSSKVLQAVTLARLACTSRMGAVAAHEASRWLGWTYAGYMRTNQVELTLAILCCVLNLSIYRKPVCLQQADARK